MKLKDFRNNIKRFSDRHPYFGLWSLITVAFIIIIVISFVDGLDLGFYNLKGASFKEKLTKAAEPDAVEAEVVVPDSIDIEKNTEKLVEPDTTVKKIFVFGDSMTSLLANRIADYGEKNGYSVTSVTWDGSSTLGWCNSDKLTKNLAETKPDFIFISLGGNEINLMNPSARSKYVKQLLEHIEGIPFIWVGPPIKGKDTKFEDMIKELIPEGTYFKTEMDLELGPDHIHPTRRGAGVWVDSIMRWMPKTPHPILSEMPDSTTPKGHFKHIYFNTKGERIN